MDESSSSIGRSAAEARTEAAATGAAQAKRKAWRGRLGWLALALGLYLPFAGQAPRRLEGVPPPVPPPSAVVLISIDTLRADAVSFDGNPVPQTPFLDRMARRGVVFSEASAPSSWTPPSMASLFTGLHPSSHGIVSGVAAESGHVVQPTLPASVGLLAESFQQAGYTTVGVPSNRHLAASLGFGRGFDFYYGQADFLDAGQVNAEVRRQLASAFGPDWRQRWKQRTFLWIHYLDPHDSYQAREPWISVYAPGYRQDPAAYPSSLAILDLARRLAQAPSRPKLISRIWPLYRSEVSYVDEQLGHLAGELGLDDDVLLAVVADHGEDIQTPMEIGHAFSLDETLLRVPFLVRWPRAFGSSARCIGGPVDLLDVYPTVAELLGLGTPAGLQGQSLAPLLLHPGRGRASPRLLHAELHSPKPRMDALRDGRWKLVLRAGPPERFSLFDLAADPAERTDLAAQLPERVRDLARSMRAWRSALPLHAPLESRAFKDDELRQQLEGMGYIGP